MAAKLGIMAKLFSLAIQFSFCSSKAKILTGTHFLKVDVDLLGFSEILPYRLMENLSWAQENDLR